MRFMWLVTGFLLFGCGGSDQEEQDQKGVFDPMVESIDKASEVEDAAMKYKEELDKKLKEMEGTVREDE